MPAELSRQSIRLLDQWSSDQAPLEVIFFVVVKSFHGNITIIGNFVSIAKNLDKFIFYEHKWCYHS